MADLPTEAESDPRPLDRALRRVFGRSSPKASPPRDPDDLFAGRFRLRGELGRGGMGIVHRAFDTVLEREVALKRLGGGASASLDRHRRFVEEAKIVGRLDHPGIVAVHDRGVTEDGESWFAMRLVNGETLKQRLDAATDPTARRALLPVLHRVTEAVAFAHAHGVVHRDLKPANVMIGAFGEVLVMDFGLATRHDAEEGTESSGTILGTPAYMAPEQARGDLRAVSARTDVYALGVMLREVIGRADDDPQLPELVAACLSDEPARRPADASEVERILAAHFARQDSARRDAELRAAAALATAAEERRARRLARAFLGFVVLAVAAGLVAFFVVSRNRRTQRDRAEAAAVAAIDLARGAREQALRSRAEEQVTAWRAALALSEAATRAAEHPDVHPEARTRATELLAATGAALAEATALADTEAADRKLLEALETSRPWIPNFTNPEGSDARYHEVFREWGVDVLALPPEALSERFRRSPLRERLALALAEWAKIRGAADVVPERDRPFLLRLAAEVALAPELKEILELRAAGHTDELEAALRRVEIRRLSPAQLARAIDDLVSAGRTVQAEELARMVVFAHPSSADAAMALCSILDRRGDPPARAEALRLMGIVRALEPTNLFIACADAVAYANAGQRDECIRRIEELHRQHPRSSIVTYFQAYMRGIVGDVATAEALYREVLSSPLTPHHAAMRLAWLLLDQKRDDEITPTMEAQIRMLRGDATARYVLGRLCFRRGASEEALHHLEFALKHEKDVGPVLETLVDVYGSRSRHTAARAQLRRIFEIAPPDAFRNRDHIDRVSRHLDDEIRRYETLLAKVEADERLPGDAASWRGLAGVLRDRGDPKREAELFALAFETAPELMPALGAFATEATLLALPHVADAERAVFIARARPWFEAALAADEAEIAAGRPPKDKDWPFRLAAPLYAPARAAWPDLWSRVGILSRREG